MNQASQPKRIIAPARTYTQSELIARALDTEEDNIRDHRDYLKNEEEKRALARVVRPGIRGPVLRWISKCETRTVIPTSSAPVQPPDIQSSLVKQTVIRGIHYTDVDPTPPKHVERVTANYVVHELGQDERTPMPSWTCTMGAMFSEDVAWDEVQVFVGKSRPLGRQRHKCLITGLPAKYRDPRTNAPYANMHAYSTITRVLGHEFEWSATLGRYVTRERPPSSIAVQDLQPATVEEQEESDVHALSPDKAPERLTEMRRKRAEVREKAQSVSTEEHVPKNRPSTPKEKSPRKRWREKGQPTSESEFADMEVVGLSADQATGYGRKVSRKTNAMDVD